MKFFLQKNSTIDRQEIKKMSINNEKFAIKFNNALWVMMVEDRHSTLRPSLLLEKSSERTVRWEIKSVHIGYVRYNHD